MVQFYPWFNFNFLMFLCVVMYGDKYKTKENKFDSAQMKPSDLVELNISAYQLKTFL